MSDPLRSSRTSDNDPAAFEDDETLIDDPAPVNDFSELDEESDSAPSDRRRDPLRHKF